MFMDVTLEVTREVNYTCANMALFVKYNGVGAWLTSLEQISLSSSVHPLLSPLNSSWAAGMRERERERQLTLHSECETEPYTVTHFETQFTILQKYNT